MRKFRTCLVVRACAHVCAWFVVSVLRALVHVCMCVCVCTCVCVGVYMCVCMWVCMWASVYVCLPGPPVFIYAKNNACAVTKLAQEATEIEFLRSFMVC